MKATNIFSFRSMLFVIGLLKIIWNGSGVSFSNKCRVFHLNTSIYDNLRISITVKDMKTKLFLLKTNVLKSTQKKFERKYQRNKRFIKLFTNVQYASPWLHSTH